MNEGYKVYSGLSAVQRESRLRRSGIEATLSSAKQILSQKKAQKHRYRRRETRPLMKELV